jgi:mRNA-degrading endonuclease RelE of RelBE toxin-antitoxin system
MAEEVVKIKLVKKSGPGEIMGEVERESINGVVSFSGLQFDQPGQYVVSAVPSSPEIEVKDFTITVGDTVVEEQEQKVDEEEKVEGSRPIIAQIDKPTYLLKPIEFERQDQTETNNEYGKNLGIMPFFWWMGYQISEKDIVSLGLYYDGLIPKVNIIFNDSLGIMKKDGYPLDDTKFEIFLNSGSENLKSVHLKFKVESFQNNRRGSYTLLGTLDLDNFYKPSYKSYTGTSFEVLRKISKELGLGFNSNINNTNDSMKWVNTGKLPFEFMSQIISHSYISDDTFLMGYIDFYYSFNYVDIEKEWKRDISDDVGIISQGMVGATTPPPGGDSDKLKKIRLTNDQSEKGSNFFISKYKLNNNSTSQSTKKGQFRIIKYYDTFKKSFLIFNIDSLTSEGDKTVILKGSPIDKTELETNYRTEYKGKIDLENTHANYLYAEIQNKINLENLVRITVDLELTDSNFNLYRYQKLEIAFTNPSPTPGAPEDIQSRISGEWIIIEIGYTWSRGKMSQNLTCARKELGKTPEELINQSTEGKKEEGNTERNENPTETPPSIPNSVYNVGDVYITNDSKGIRYQLTITEVSSNGIEVVANVEKLESPTGLTESNSEASGVTASGGTASGGTASVS